MIARPSFVVVGTTLFALVLTAAAILSPVPAGLEFLAPEYVGALRLREAEGIPRGRVCDMTADAWQYRELLRGRHPEIWFQSVLDHAVTPEARLYGLAGLRATDSLAFLQALRAVPATAWAAPVRIFDQEVLLGHRLPALSLLPVLVTGDLGREWMLERPEC